MPGGDLPDHDGRIRKNRVTVLQIAERRRENAFNIDQTLCIVDKDIMQIRRFVL